jgi:hypothetical protein
MLAEIHVRAMWWLGPYMTGAVLLHRLGVAINFGRLARAIDRGVIAEIVEVGGARRRWRMRIWSGAST